MRIKGTKLTLLETLFFVSAYSPPRGGPIASEVVGENRTPDDIQVTAVDRITAKNIAEWPKSGWLATIIGLRARRVPKAALSKRAIL